jgi:hypothetical protein
MAQQSSGWQNDFESDIALNHSPEVSEEDVPLSPVRVDRANHDKNLSRTGAIIPPKKGSYQNSRANSQKSLPIFC